LTDKGRVLAIVLFTRVIRDTWPEAVYSLGHSSY